MSRLIFVRPSSLVVATGVVVGALLGVSVYAIAELWLQRAGRGEFEPQRASESLTELKEVKVVDVSAHRSASVEPKPSMSELVRETDAESNERAVTDYGGAFNPDGKRSEMVTKVALTEEVEEIDEDDVFGEDDEDSELTPDASFEDEETVVPMRNRPVIPKYVRDAMHKRYRVITESAYKNDNPYFDKYTATYFIHDGILGGFDGDIKPVADEMLEAMAYEAIAVKGVENLYLSDEEGESEFHIVRSDEDFDTAYAEKYPQEGHRFGR